MPGGDVIQVVVAMRGDVAPAIAVVGIVTCDAVGITEAVDAAAAGTARSAAEERPGHDSWRVALLFGAIALDSDVAHSLQIFVADGFCLNSRITS